MEAVRDMRLGDGIVLLEREYMDMRTMIGGVSIPYSSYQFAILTSPDNSKWVYAITAPVFICGEKRSRQAFNVCGLPPNHGGRHRAGTYSWLPGIKQMELFPGYHRWRNQIYYFTFYIPVPDDVRTLYEEEGGMALFTKGDTIPLMDSILQQQVDRNALTMTDPKVPVGDWLWERSDLPNNVLYNPHHDSVVRQRNYDYGGTLGGWKRVYPSSKIIFKNHPSSISYNGKMIVDRGTITSTTTYLVGDHGAKNPDPRIKAKLSARTA